MTQYTLIEQSSESREQVAIYIYFLTGQITGKCLMTGHYLTVLLKHLGGTDCFIRIYSNVHTTKRTELKQSSYSISIT